MAVRASGRTQTRAVGDGARRGDPGPVDTPAVAKPQDFRSLADQIDFLGDALGLRQAYIARRDEWLEKQAKSSVPLAGGEPESWYTIEVKGPRSVNFVLHFPDGTRVGSTGATRKAAVDGVLRKLPAFVTDAKAKKALDQVITQTPKSAWAAADDTEEGE